MRPVTPSWGEDEDVDAFYLAAIAHRVEASGSRLYVLEHVAVLYKRTVPVR